MQRLKAVHVWTLSMTPKKESRLKMELVMQSCSKLIDTDIIVYLKETATKLEELAEQTAILEVPKLTSSTLLGKR